MGIVIKQSSISTVFTYLGTFIGFINTVILFPAFLSAEQIGLVRALPSAAFMLMPLAQLGMVRAVIKFSPELRKTREGMAQFTFFVLAMVIAGGLMTATLVYIFRDSISGLFIKNAPLFSEYIYVVIVLIMVLALYTLLESFSRIFLKIVAVNIIREVLLRVLMGVAVSMCFLEWITFHQLTVGLIAVYGTTLLSVVGYLVHKGFIKISFHLDAIDKTLRKRIINYSMYSLIGAGGGYVILNVDQVMVTSMIGLEANGIYSTAFYFAVMVELSRRAIIQITTPLVSEFFENKDLQAIEGIYRKVSINQMVIGLLFFIGIVSNMHNIYALMPNGTVYSAGYWVVFIIGIAKLIDMSFSNSGEIIIMSDHYRFNVVTMAVLASLMVYLNYVLIPTFGLNGAALATLASALMYNMTKLIFVKIKLGIIPFSANTIVLLLISTVVLAIGYFLPKLSNSYLDIIVRSTLIIGIYGSAVYFLNVSAEVKAIVGKVLGFIK